LCPGPINTEIVRSSARHRDEAQSADLTEQAARLEDRFMSNLSDQLAVGMDPAEVGDLMLDAIRNERFWVLTHPNEFMGLLERRVDQIKADHAHRMVED
jgi:hypothetical protein